MAERFQRITPAVVALAAAMLLTACDLSMANQALLSRTKDTTPPSIAVSSPADGVLCANIVEVRGSVSDLPNESGSGSIASLRYEVPATSVSGEVEIAANGSFVFQFLTDTLSTAFTLSITAVDWNANQATVRVSLKKDPSDSLPSFAATASNKKVVLTWDPVPNTESYAIYYSSDGSLPAEGGDTTTTIDNASSPLSLGSCENGSLYTFRIKAIAGQGGEDSASDYVRVIPLADQTLCPVATPGRGQISLAWKEIPGTDEFQVYRRVGDQGEFGFYRNVSGYGFVDTAIDNATRYYYRVRPAANSTVMSAFAAARSDGFSSGYSMSIVPRSTTTAGVKMEAFGSCSRGDYLYVAGYNYGKGYVNVLKASDNSLLSTIALPSTAYRAAAPEGGDLLLVAAGSSGFLVYDLSVPTAPRQVAYYKPSSGVDIRGLAVSGSGDSLRAYAVDYCKYVYRFDLASPSGELTPAASFALDVDMNNGAVPFTGTPYSTGWAVAAAGGTARVDAELSADGRYLFASNARCGLQVFDTTGAANPIKTISVGTNLSDANTMGLTGFDLDGDRLFACVKSTGTGNDGLAVLDASDPPSLPSSLAVAIASSQANDIAVEGTTAFMTVQNAGVVVYDVSKEAPRQVGAIPMPISSAGWGGSHGIDLNRGHAYVCQYMTDNMELYDLDLNMPIQPSLEATLDLDAMGWGIAVQGDIAYVAQGEKGVALYDLGSDASAPERVGAIATDLPAVKVALAGEYAYIAERNIASESSTLGNVLVYDVADPRAPKKLGAFGGNSYLRSQSTGTYTAVNDLAVFGGYAFVLALEGLYIYDVSVPSRPTFVSETTIPFNSGRIALSGRYAIIGSNNTGSVSVVDVRDPSKAPLVSSMLQDGKVSDIALSGGYAFIPYETGFAISEAQDPANMGSSKTFTYPGEYAMRGAGFGSWGIVATYGASGSGYKATLRFYDISDFANTRLISALSRSGSDGEIWDAALAVSGPFLYAAGRDGKLRVYNLRP